MKDIINVNLQPLAYRDGDIVSEAVLEIAGSERHKLWFKTTEDQADHLSHKADTFILAVLFHAMQLDLDIWTDGPTSPSLIRNLYSFQTVWARWMPERYHHININSTGDDSKKSDRCRGTVTAFSGGLDSCFSVWNQTRQEPPAVRRAPDAGIMVHGLDIPLSQQEVFARAALKSKNILADAGVSLLTMATNLRSFAHDWNDSHGAGVAACLHSMGRRHDTALIPGTHAYEALRLPFGSNPLTDPLLSSDSLEILYEGAGFSRVEKAAAVAEWPEALRNIRVCWEGDKLDRNCGYCGKCLALAICFVVNRLPIPDCLPISDLSAVIRKIMKKDTLPPFGIIRMEERLALAEERGIREPWVSAVEDWVRISRRKLRHSIFHSLIGAAGKASVRYANGIRKRFGKKV